MATTYIVYETALVACSGSAENTGSEVSALQATTSNLVAAPQKPVDTVPKVIMPSPEVLMDSSAVALARLNGEQSDIPLDPGHGGRSILQEELQPGDIIFSTTGDIDSYIIRLVSGNGPISHVQVYVGKFLDERTVIESRIGPGVVRTSLDEVLSKDRLAVVFRVRGITGAQQTNLLDFLNGEVGKPYYRLYLLEYPFAKLFSYEGHLADVHFGNPNPDKYFCSQLVEEAFKRTGMPVFTATPYIPSPNDLAGLAIIQDKLEYIGHLRTP